MSQLGKWDRFDKDRQASLVGRLYQAAAGAPDWVELVDIWSAFYFPVIAEAPSEQLSRPDDIASWSQDELNRHFKQAVGLLAADQAITPDDALHALDQFPFALAFTNARGEIRLLNQTARESIGDGVIGRPLVDFVTRTMTADDPKAPPLSAGLRASAGASLRFADFATDTVEAPAILLNRDDLMARDAHELSPLHLGLLSLFEAEPALTGAAIILAVQLDDASAQQLRKIYNLTKSELQLVRELVDGKSIQMVSETRKKSPTTIRNQLQSVFSKTGTNRQSQLVALVYSQIFVSNLGRTFLIGDGVNTRRTSGPQVWRDYAGGAVTSSIIELTDGRNLKVLQHGDPHGRPCILFHPTVLPPFLPAPAIAASRTLGLRCVAPVRPGFAASTPVKFSPHVLDEFAADLCQVLDHLGIARAPVIASGLGAIWALRFAELHPNRVSTMHIGTIPLAPGRSDAKQSWDLLGTHRRVSLFNPVVLPLVTRIQLHHFTRASRDERKRGLQRIYFAPEADLEALEDEELLDWALSWATPEGMRSQKGIISDLRIQDETPWAAHAKAVKAPIKLWHGSANPLNPLPLIEQFAADRPNVDLTVIEGAGELFFYQILDRVLAEIASTL